MRVLAIRAATISPSTAYLELPPRSERYLLYAVIEDDRHARYLAVIGYRGRHEYIDLALDVMVDLDEIGDFRYLALGELRLVNGSNRVAPGRIVAVNETAGYFARVLAARNDHRNVILEVLPFLTDAFPWFATPALTVTSIDDSRRSRAFHLFPHLDTFIEHLDALREAGALEPSENYRHYIGNRVALAASASASLNAGARRRGGRYDRRHLQGLARLVTEQPTNQALQLYLQWAENDGATVPNSDRIAQTLHRARAGLPREDWERFARDFDAFVMEAMTTGGAPYLASTVQVLRFPNGTP